MSIALLRCVKQLLSAAS